MIAQALVAGRLITLVPMPIVSRGMSETAQFVQKVTTDQHELLRDPHAYRLRRDQSTRELEDVTRNCSSEGWDGYKAAPVQVETFDNALRFLKSLPPGVAEPSVSAEPDGNVTFEWHQDPQHTLSISVDAGSDLHYAALLGPRVRYGTEPFFGELTQELIQLISEITVA